MALAWLPRVDGVFLTADPQDLITQGSVADIPFVTGDCDDEGTLFSLSSLNITLVYYSYHISRANFLHRFLARMLNLQSIFRRTGSPVLRPLQSSN